MTGYRTIMMLLVVSSLSMAAENDPPTGQPEVTLQPSKYVEFTGSNLIVSDTAITFEGTFIVLGEGIYGHFDMIVYNDSGAVQLVASSTDQTYRRDRGPKVKSIRMETACPEKCLRVEVSFHETRLEPDAGACKPK